MPSKVSNGAQGVTPVVVEVKPRSAAPYTPSPPPSPKAVRFAPSLVQGASRPLTNTEEWSLWHFEHHASKCRKCFDPYTKFKQGDRLCSEGHALAQDVALNVVFDGDFYATRKEDNKLVRVEIKPGYSHVEGLLRALDRRARHAERRQPVISYDRNDQTSARYPQEQKPKYHSDKRDRKETVIIEPASSRPERKPSHRSRYPAKRYDTVVVDEDVEAPRPSPSTTKYKERRGTLYDEEIARFEKEKGYRVEVREPERRRGDRDRDGRRRERYD